MGRIKVGISSCLMGTAVRYDGGHKRSVLCLDELSAHFEFVPDCPEFGAGLGVPRPPVRLVGDPAAPRALGVADASLDVTGALQDYAARRMPALGELCGYIFIRNSPSCGLYRVPVHGNAGEPPHASGRGLFATTFTSAYPEVPVEEEGRLRDPILRDSFLTRVVVLRAWRQLCAEQPAASSLRNFHARCALLLQARAGRGQEDSGQEDRLAPLLNQVGQGNPQASGAGYFQALMAYLQYGATRRGHVGVLRQLQAQLAPRQQRVEREELAEYIDRYGRGCAPLALPLAAVRRCIVPQKMDELADQFYLQLVAPTAT